MIERRQVVRGLLAGIVLAGASFLPGEVKGDEVTYLPGAAETAGQAGAKFSSTLTIFNPGPTAASVRIGLIQSPDKFVPVDSTRTIQAGQTDRIQAVLATLFGLEQASGTLVATSASPLIFSLSTQNVANPAGSYGLAVLPVPDSALLSEGETGHAVWASQSGDPSSGFRTNVAVTLVDPGSEVNVGVYDEFGYPVGGTVVSSSSPSTWQAALSDLIGSRPLPLGRVEFTVVRGRATGYTVVNDNVTSDAIASQAERVGTGPADRLLDGAAKTFGPGGSFWSTDVRLFNPGNLPLDVTIEAVGFLKNPSPIVQTVPAAGLLELSGVLDAFGFPAGVAGALRFRAGAPLLVGARTVDRDPTGQRPGAFASQQFVVDLPSALLGAGKTGYFVGVDQTSNVPGVRSNLALLGGPSGASGRLVLRDSSGSELASTTFSRLPFQWAQLNMAEWFPPTAQRSTGGSILGAIPGASRVDVEVATGSVDAYVTRIDNGTGDPTSVPFSLEPTVCATLPFSVESFAVSPKPLWINQPGTLSWTFRRNGTEIPVKAQEFSIGGAIGISLDPSARTFDVQFAAAGPHTAIVTAHDACRTASRSLEIVVCQLLNISPSALPAGTAGLAYSAALTADGVPPLTWSATGALPEGLVLAPTGEISGTPSRKGSATFDASVVDANGCSAKGTYTIAVSCSATSIMPTSVPDGTTGAPWGPVKLQQFGGSGTGTWRIVTGSLPPGIDLSSAGVLAGTPTTPGSFVFTIGATDAAGCEATVSLAVSICSTISVFPASLQGAAIGVAYFRSLTVVGGSGKTTFAVTSGSLPPGLSLSPSGTLSGTPSTTGTFPFTVTATDSLGCSGSKDYAFAVSCPSITVSPATARSATVGNFYLQMFSVTGTSGFKTFSVTYGAVPQGLTLSEQGVLSGTPLVAGTFRFTVTVTDALGCSGSQDVTLAVN